MAQDVPFHPEVSRKLLHLSSAITPLVYLVAERSLILWLLAGCIAIAALVEILRRANSAFHRVFRGTVGNLLRRREWRRVTGATYVLVAQWLSVFLFPKPIAIAVLLILSISDSAASLVGLRFGRSPFLGKSLAGSLAFFVTALLVLWVVLPDSPGIVFAAALLATFVEAIPVIPVGPLELNDNLLVPLLTGTLIWALLGEAAAGPLISALPAA